MYMYYTFHVYILLLVVLLLLYCTILYLIIIHTYHINTGGNALFNPTKVLEQLRSTGLVDAAAVARTHYKVKMPLRDFYKLYRGIVGGECTGCTLYYYCI